MGNDAAAAAAGEADRAFQQFQDEGGISNPLFRGASGKQGAAGHVTYATTAVHDSRPSTICSSVGRPLPSWDVSGWCHSATLRF